MFLKFLNIANKLAWAFFNRFPPKPAQYEKRGSPSSGDASTLVIAIDYDKFFHRKTKTVGATTYPCGRDGLDHVLSYCKNQDIDYLDVITTDDESSRNFYDGQTNLTVHIRNGGSDIAALEALSKVIRRYSFVMVINSSANVTDAHKIDVMHRELAKDPAGHFVIGCNGNSRISPRLPLSPARTPHVITNFFAAPAQDVLSTLAHAQRLRLYASARGFANKYFAIRYFEILLSRNALSNEGVLVLLKDNDVVRYREPKDHWPKGDSRLISR